jgi:MinD-like ATPase involved in chromosome partitioning or flagellar assembly
MEQEIRLVLIDSDYEYIRTLEEELIRRFASRARIQIITDPAYVETFFHTTRTVDVLLADRNFCGPYLDEHTVRHILLLAPEIEIGQEYPEKVKVLMKYLPVEEIMQAVEEAVAEEEAVPREELLPEEKPETRVISVYSPMGGCGKSLVAMALGRKLKKLDQSVLLIGCDTMQSFSAFMEEEEYADEALAEQLKAPGEETYWNILQNIGRKEISCLLPFEKTLPALGIGAAEMKNLISILKEKKDFSCLILDLGSSLDEQTLALMEESDAYVLITEPNTVSNRKMRRLQKNMELLPSKKCFMISNQYHMDGLRVPQHNLFGVLAGYEDYEEAMEDPVFYRIAMEISG